ncbi:hypothetical protein [Amycolatopsis dongchuanensis]|uniref:Capsular polysaccharide biosynthesis protein n=1 Tax=Amycolatopsis dongchuanensis TaxID=1070866 RepID=A0ABP9R882_9PSEU
MDFWATIRVLVRRWYVAVPVFLVALGLAGGVYASVDTQYESTGTIVLTSPAAGARAGAGPSPEKINPLLAFDGSLTTSAEILIQSLQDPATVKQFEHVDGVKTTYEVGNGQLSGPFVVVVADAAAPQAAEKTVAAVLDLARKQLADRQQALQAPQSTYISADQVINPTPAEAKIGGKVRYAAVALALGLVAGLTAAYGFESFQQHRKRKPRKEKPKERPQEQEQEPSWPEEGDEDLSEELTKLIAPVSGTAEPRRRRDRH